MIYIDVNEAVRCSEWHSCITSAIYHTTHFSSAELFNIMDGHNRPLSTYRNSHGQQSSLKRDRDNSHGEFQHYRRLKLDEDITVSRPTAGSVPSSPPQTLSTIRKFYERDFPLYKQPLEIGRFSLDSERRFYNDDRQLRYYVEPDKSPNFKLSDGYPERYVRRNEAVKEGLDHLLRWILTNRSKLEVPQAAAAPLSSACDLGVDFITWRGHLTKLLTTPYETREGWMMAVTLLNGTLYMSEVETDAARIDRETRSARQKEMMYWGYKFEQYTCAAEPGGRPDEGGVVNTNEAFCTVVRTRLAAHRLLFSGEVDCRDRDPHAPPAPSCYLELKTSAEICTPKQLSNFHRYKLLKWWAQSFLPGVPRIIAGFRDGDGVVVSVETYQTSRISQLIKNEYNCWKPTVCMNFCAEFLSFARSVVKEDNARVVYLFSWEPHRDVSYSIHRDSQYCFLPDWYVREITQPQCGHKTTPHHSPSCGTGGNGHGAAKYP